MSEYTPTTEEIREHVEIGGEPRPWEPPTPERDAARVAAFDRWLAVVIADAKAEQREHDAVVAELTTMMLPAHVRAQPHAYSVGVRDAAARIRASGQEGETHA